jgi:uncharacterized protein YggE
MNRASILLALTLITSSAFAQMAAPSDTAVMPSNMPAPRVPALVETISVTGTGHSSVAPDRYTFTVGVQTVAATVDQALNENNSRVASVLAALKAAGAKNEEVRTANFNIFPQQDYQQGKLPRIVGYQVSNDVTVRRTSLTDAGKMLQIAVNAGVNSASGLNFEVSDPTRGRDAGLQAAFADARAKAALLAQASGRTLGRVLTIVEGGAAQPPQPIYAERGMMAKSQAMVSEVPVTGGAQELTFAISATFELR